MGGHVCPAAAAFSFAPLPIAGSVSFHNLAIIVAGATCAVTCLISIFLIMMHAIHYSVPKEQTQIIRIVFCAPVFAIISLLDCAFIDASQYIQPWRVLYEAFSLACFFVLLCTYISPHEYGGERSFEGYELQNDRGQVLKNGSLDTFNRLWICIFQFPVVTLILTIATMISEARGTFCKTSRSIHFVHIWVVVISLISTAIAVASILRFYKATKEALAHHKTGLKLVSLKLIVFLNFIQNIIFTFGMSKGFLKPSKTLSANDLAISLPNLLLACEVVFIAASFLFTYSWTPYRNINTPQDPSKGNLLGNNAMIYRGGPLGINAILDALNPLDFLMCLRRGISMFGSRK